MKFMNTGDLKLDAATGIASLVLPFACIPLVASAFQSRIFRKAMTALPVTVIGGMCYTIYLYHELIISGINKYLFKLLRHTTAETALAISAAIGISVVLLVSAALFLTFEKPFMNLRLERRPSDRAEKDHSDGQIAQKSAPPEFARGATAGEAA
jgi:peptidoglycan/LPS O-acetylase OafA/YrhL